MLAAIIVVRVVVWRVGVLVVCGGEDGGDVWGVDFGSVVGKQVGNLCCCFGVCSEEYNGQKRLWVWMQNTKGGIPAERDKGGVHSVPPISNFTWCHLKAGSAEVSSKVECRPSVVVTQGGVRRGLLGVSGMHKKKGRGAKPKKKSSESMNKNRKVIRRFAPAPVATSKS
jgi:hypothetical protein